MKKLITWGQVEAASRAYDAAKPADMDAAGEYAMGKALDAYARADQSRSRIFAPAQRR